MTKKYVDLIPEDDEARIEQLVDANHILANEGAVDGFGHVSVRSAADPDCFFMSRARAPELVSAADLMLFDRECHPRHGDVHDAYAERFIHGELYAARPDVMSIVHSHCPEVLPFATTEAPLKALIHMAAFLGNTASPVFDIRDVLGEDNRILVTERRTGAALAGTLGDRTVVLMRGHGMTVVAPSVRLAVMRAIYTQLNARIEATALQIGSPVFLNAWEASRTDPVDRPWERWIARLKR